MGEGEGGDLFRGGVHRGGALVRRRDERGGGVERGFGSVPVHSVFLLPSCDMRYFQYTSSRADACGEPGHCMGRFALFVLGSTQNLHV